jgi:hypothetical protein
MGRHAPMILKRSKLESAGIEIEPVNVVLDELTWEVVLEFLVRDELESPPVAASLNAKDLPIQSE